MWGAVIAGVSALVGAAGASSAASAQSRANQRAIEEQRRQFDISMETLQPRLEAEQNALNQLQSAMGLGGEEFDPSLITQTPGYQFQMDQGQQALERSAAARGGLQSGNTLAAATELGQGMAQQGYQQYVNNLLNLAGGRTDQSAAGMQQNFANNISSLQQNQGAIRASGIGGVTGALTGGLQGGYQNYQYNQMMNRLSPTGQATSAATGAAQNAGAAVGNAMRSVY